MIWTITVGEAATIATMMAGTLGIFFGVKSDVRIVKHDLHALNDKVATLNLAFSGLSTVLTQVAVQDNRLNRVEDDVRELKHGEGMVLPLRRGSFETP